MFLHRFKRHYSHELIKKPGRRLLHKVPLETIQRHVSGGGHRAVSGSLNLTSFIDFLITVVVFLLMSFSATGEVPIDKNTKLPAAENTVDMVTAPMISIVGSQIRVDGAVAGSTRGVIDSGRLQKIDELHGILKNKREMWKQIHPQESFPGVVIMQIDYRVPALVVKSVFQTAARAGYPNVSFMVSEIPKTKKGGEH